jgi:lysophospholipase L1-like esterase
MARSARRRRPRACLAVAAVSAAVCLTATPAHATARPSWVGTWGASPLAATTATMQVTHLADQTVRNIVYSSVGGDRVRIRVSNSFGDRTVTIGSASIGIEALGARVTDVHRLTFNGKRSVDVQKNAEILSDPVAMRVPPLRDLAVSLYLPQDTGTVTSHFLARQDNYLASGNHAMDTGDTTFGTTVTAWYLLDDVLVSGSSRGTVATLGDSITDGDQSQVNANMRWPNELARRLVARYGARAPGVVDEGIAGNRVLNDSACLGINARARLMRDVLGQPRLQAVVLMEGINDIGFSAITAPCTVPNPDVSAAQIIAGYEAIIDRVHAAGVPIYGATLTPWKSSTAWTPAGEAKRAAVNHWIQTSGAFDSVIDFAKVIQNPQDPQLIDPKYDSGDHIHPNDAGYSAMGDSINLKLFAAHRGHPGGRDDHAV